MVKKVKISKKLLEEMAAALMMADCQYSACKGFKEEPEIMVTCARCHALHDLFKERPDLKRKFLEEYPWRKLRTLEIY